MHAAEDVFLITALSGCASQPVLLALPLAMLQRLLHGNHGVQSTGDTGAAVALVPPACVQLIAQHAPERPASPLAQSVASKVLEVQSAWACDSVVPSAACMRYAVAAATLGLRGSPHGRHSRPAAAVTFVLRQPAALTDAAWVPLLLAAASLELGDPQGEAWQQPVDQDLQQALVQHAQHTCGACSADALRGCIGAALATWWLLDPHGRAQVLTAAVTRTQVSGQRGAACLGEVLRAIEHMAGSTVCDFLSSQDALLLHLGTSLADHPQVLFPRAWPWRCVHTGRMPLSHTRPRCRRVAVRGCVA